MKRIKEFFTHVLVYVLLVVSVFIMGGCAFMTKPAPAPIVIRVPAPVYCVAPDVTKPTPKLPALPATATIFDKVKAMLLELEERINYEFTLESTLDACAKPTDK